MIFGPNENALPVPNAEAATAQLLQLADEELARSLISAVENIEERNSVLWLLARSFHAVGHEQQCQLVTRTIQGFAALPLSEQVQVVQNLAPKLRTVRRGWREAALEDAKQRRRGNSEDDKSGTSFKLVGVLGRHEGNTHIVEVLDEIDHALKRLSQDKRARLYRRLDHAVSVELPPSKLSALFAELSSDLVLLVEEWLVDEDVIPQSAAANLLASLAQQGQAQTQNLADLANGARKSISSSYDALRKLSEEWAEGDVDGFWKNWVKGRAPSPTPSVRSVRVNKVDGMSVRTSGTVRNRRKTASVIDACERVSIASTFSDKIKNKSKDHVADYPLARRSAIQVYCPPEVFLWTGAPKVARTSRVSLNISSSSRATVKVSLPPELNTGASPPSPAPSSSADPGLAKDSNETITNLGLSTSPVASRVHDPDHGLAEGPESTPASSTPRRRIDARASTGDDLAVAFGF